MKKTVFITGASSGFGKETAQLFHDKGWNVIATMRSPEKEQVLTQLENVFITKLDVQDPASITAAVQAGIRKFGTIDVLINNAGHGLMGVFESSASAQIKDLYAINVFGLMDVTRAILPHMRENGSGAIINISSFGGMVGLPFGSPYNSSKFAVEGFSEALSHELAPLHIFVKVVEPGSVATNFRNNSEIIKSEIPVYAPYMAGFFGRYPELTKHLLKATAADVANTIFSAATDGTAQLRYVVGEDAQFFIDAKLKNTDTDYIKNIREFTIGSTERIS